MKKLILLICFIAIAVEGFSQWTVQQFTPEYNGLHFINGMPIGYAVGDRGVIRKTTDGGTTWVNQSSGTFEDLNAVSFEGTNGNINKGFAAGYNGVILKTTNGGTNWVLQTSGVTNEILDVDVSRGDSISAVGTFGLVLRTTNGGTNWTAQYIDAPSNIESILFYSFTTGYITTGSGKVYLTADAGASWINRPTPLSVPLYDIAADLNTLIAVGFDGKIIKSTNGGLNWTTNTIRGSNPSLTSICRFNSTTYLITNDEGSIYRSTNTGTNFTEVLSSSFQRTLQGIELNDNAGSLIAMGKGGTIVRSSNGGANWSYTNGIPNYSDGIYSLQFIDALTGFTVGGDQIFQKTTNGGINWSVQYVDNTDAIYSIYFINSTTGYVSGIAENTRGAGGIILKTTNGGGNWTTAELSQRVLTNLQFSDANTGWVLGNSGALDNTVGTFTLYRTTNAGSNWNEIYAFSELASDLQFINSTTGIAISYNGIIARTTNGGLNWSAAGSTPFDPTSVHFQNLLRGYICGEQGKIYATTNGGVNWTLQTTPTTGYLNDIHFGSLNKGLCVGENGTRLITSNGGLNWISQNDPCPVELSTCYMPTGSLGIAAGSYGYISRNVDVATGTGQDQDVNPSSFMLEQNYPNPFNPVTIINYQLSTFNTVSLEVYDISGKLIRTLVNGSQAAGNYSVTFDGSGLSSGVYFYKLETEQFTQTKKMLLIK